MKKLLCVFAHPDDEAFGPGGTIAKYAHEGVEIHLLCATKGEGGKQSEEVRNANTEVEKTTNLDEIREQELLASAKVLGIKRVEFLGYKDGTICNANYHEIAQNVIDKIQAFKPQVVMTFDRLGVSGHLDHMGMAMITTYAFMKTTEAQKLYYYCSSREVSALYHDSYFVYFPYGYTHDQITTTIDLATMWDTKTNAMNQHKSQWHDVVRIQTTQKDMPKKEYFILSEESRVKIQGKETDLFNGI